MRKIELEMNAAIRDSINWKSGNTEVTFDSETGESKGFWQGNPHATVGDDFV